MTIPWTDHLTVNAFGYLLRFRWSESSLAEPVRRVLLSDWPEEPEATPQVTFSLWRDEGGIHIQQNEARPLTLAPPRIEIVADELRREVHLDIATYAPDLVFVHAGVVLSEAGLIVIPGRSYAGKSTLVQALVACGCRYYSDEYAVIRHDGAVLPFPRPLCQRLPDGRERFIAPTELAWSPELGPARVAAVVSTEFATQTTWEPETMSPGQAVLALFSNTVSAQIAPKRAVQFLPKAVESAVCLGGKRGEAGEAAREILNRVLQTESGSP